ncbi:helix-turn-helix transcriptional regulator [Ornithinimicrobium sp. CNJ-824]|uniref:helix-turn-helix transcriptional regulator n=1 Tax=Ornithinimicrobium sp. CNJ-824 TaxID=1904966 RepID=UPI001EDC220D|nr:helix-turn-helix domain-containing protein [Ornithinimicrobium sp. CNJ-824]
MGAAEHMGRDGAFLLTSAVRRSIVDHLVGLPRLAVEGRPTRDGGMTAAELGTVLGLHSTTVRFHLDQLVSAGLVGSHFVRSGGAGRPAKRYFVVEGELGPVARGGGDSGHYKVLATLLAGALDPSDEGRLTPEEAGAEWVRDRLEHGDDHRLLEDGGPPPPAGTSGEWMAKVGGIVDLLQEWGYTPDLSLSGREGDVTLTLRECPFLDLARVHPEVVCGVHRGLLKGALDAAGEPDAGVSLRPFVGPGTCHAVVLRHATPPEEPIVPGPGRWAAPPRPAAAAPDPPGPVLDPLPAADEHDIPPPTTDRPPTPPHQENPA